MTAKRDDDLFDFTTEIFGSSSVPEIPDESQGPSDQPNFQHLENEIRTSYVLVNALLNLLIQKGVIYPHEVEVLIQELHSEYMKNRRGA